MSEHRTPANAIELYEMLTQTSGLCGQLTLKNERELCWSLYKDFNVSIGISKVDACVMIERKLFGGFSDILTHWHSEPSEIYKDICDIGFPSHVLVIRKSFFGDAVLYAGPRDKCPYSPKQKWYWGKLYYLAAEE